MEDKTFKPLPSDGVPKYEPKEPIGLKLVIACGIAALIAVTMAFLVVGTNIAPDFLVTDGYCDRLIENATNQSFINGTSFGLEYAVASITQEAIQCNSIPIEYANYSFSLIAVECLNLNNTGGNK